MSNKELARIGIIFSMIVSWSWCFGLIYDKNKEISSLNADLFQSMSIAVELNDANNGYITMLDSMNKYADELHSEIDTLENHTRIIKDLRRGR